MLEIFDLKKSEFLTNYHGTTDPFLHIEHSMPHGQRLTLSSSYFGTALPLYFMVDEEKLYLADCLLELKEASQKPFYLNTDLVPQFLYNGNGFLPGINTLVQGVYKLPPRKRLVVEGGTYRIETIDFSLPNTPDNDESLEDLYDKALYGALLEKAPNSTNINLALSSGFDSNLLLYLTTSIFPTAHVNCFSVGGKKGVNETRKARAYAKNYPQTSFYSALVSPETLDAFDDIVARLQGIVYERGIFLQYELAKNASDHNCTHLICGECADQVFNTKCYLPSSEEEQGNYMHFSYKKTPLTMASHIVLHKSALMLRSFGITGVYPYLDERVIRIGAMTRLQNGTSKEFHKQQCKRHLPPKIFNKLHKTGGSTLLNALVDKRENYKALCKQQTYYSPDFTYSNRLPRKEAIMDYYLSLRFVESFERQFCDKLPGNATA